MSASLVRKGLELFADDYGDSEGTLSKNKKKGPSSMKREDIMKGIGTNRKGVKKQLNRIRRKEIQRPSAKERPIKSSIDVYKKSQPADCTEANVQLLLGLSRSNPLTTNTYAKILQHSRGRLAKDKMMEEDEAKTSKKEGGFTDEDFELFDKEYMPKKRDSVL